MNYELLVAILGTGGVFWAVLAASRKRPKLVLDVKGHGSRQGRNKDTHDVFFHCEIKNRNVEKNSVEKLIFTIWNSRNTEYIWEAWYAELYYPEKGSNWIGDKIDTPLVLDGKSGKECIAVLNMPNEVYYNYLADRMPRLVNEPGYEKPFKYRLILRDSHGTHFTGDLGNDKVHILDYASYRFMSVVNMELSNACHYGRPRVKIIAKFYTGRAFYWLRFRIRKLFYYLGLTSSV